MLHIVLKEVITVSKQPLFDENDGVAEEDVEAFYRFHKSEDRFLKLVLIALVVICGLERIPIM